ncbi:hypothetical protein HDU76_012273 [Blyttiomyces sp. JEL0837]|nr:hypothetical protein HDU76_012273 [Blyttiomyces sp. JEL0837]
MSSSKTASVRDKTRQGCLDHIASLKPGDTRILFGDSHIERLVWKYPQLAPPNTWLCGIGGDRTSLLQWRIQNPEGLGYTQSPIPQNAFTHIGIMIGSNDIGSTKLTAKQLTNLLNKVKEIKRIVETRWPDALVSCFPIPLVPLCGVNERDVDSVMEYNRLLKMEGLIVDGLVDDDKDSGKIDLVTGFDDHVHMSQSGYIWFRENIVDKFFEMDPNRTKNDIGNNVTIGEETAKDTDNSNDQDSNINVDQVLKKLESLDLSKSTPADLEVYLNVCKKQLSTMESMSSSSSSSTIPLTATSATIPTASSTKNQKRNMKKKEGKMLFLREKIAEIEKLIEVIA